MNSPTDVSLWQEEKRKVRVQIIFQTEEEVETTIDILNSLRDEINKDLGGIEFIVATKGSIVLHVEILAILLETDQLLQSTLTLFLRRILERITTFNTETIDLVLIPVQEFTRWNAPTTMGEQKKEAYSKSVIYEEKEDAYSQSLKYEENTTKAEESFTQAQTPVKPNLPVSVTLLQHLKIKKSTNETLNITSCIKIGNTLVFAVYNNNRLIICNSDGTDIHHIPLYYTPHYLTEIDSNTVAVSCTDSNVLIIKISTRCVTSRINISSYCLGISYNDNILCVVIDWNIIHVMDLTGKVIRTIPLPSHDIRDITVDRDRLVCIDYTSIYCCSLDGKIIWKFEKDKFQDLCCVTTDNEGNVYVTDGRTHTVIVVSNDGQRHKEPLTKSDGLYEPNGIYFDKNENILLVCNNKDGKAFLCDVKRKST
ncbi:unnamed protein product [Mytilus edulis]|uniref:Uncharacterized protein n=1 Tax=Mytilus edulis TaxID=6550 RepID=A0A8S3RG32_MYTED|nr:unnamed protein product [Mytilus edulis]